MIFALNSTNPSLSQGAAREIGSLPARLATHLISWRVRSPRAWSSRFSTCAIAGVLATLLGAAGASDIMQLGLADFRQGRFAEAFEEWQRADAAGDARGALYIGVLYDTGLGVARDPVQARVWYQRSADAGSAVGAFNLAVMNDAGIGGPRNLPTAAAWYARAAKVGYGRAEYNLASLYETGSGVPRNRARAVALYTQAAAHGITAARAHLAALGQLSLAPPRAGPSEPAQDVAMQVFTQAQQELLSRGVGAAAQAFALFHRAAEEHNPPAEYDLGYCYEYGIGVARDAAQARQWYQRAATDSTDPTLLAVAKAAVAGSGGSAARPTEPK